MAAGRPPSPAPPPPPPPGSEMLPILPTPPRSKMLPLLPTPHGVVLTMLEKFREHHSSKLGLELRWAGSNLSCPANGSTPRPLLLVIQRWDWNKTGKKPCSSICSSSSSSLSSGSESTGRADSVDRWDSGKKYKKPRTTMSSSSSSSYSAGSPGRTDSVERWDSKKLATSSPPTGRGRHDGNNKRLPSPGPARASSAERWDLHKKPRSEHMPQRTNATATAPQKAVFAGPSFYASPDPSMLPMPSFFLLAR
uniref:Uncharacterized protein n=1 Tax=Aegilops tauschii TaxID=37682 RepID=M8CDD8_AEGTA